MSMRYLVAPVRIPLDSVSQICDSGAVVSFHKSGGTITDPDGTVTEFKRDRNTYYRETWVRKDAAGDGQTATPFTRQSPAMSS